jgi:predicted solute-binding protein
MSNPQFQYTIKSLKEILKKHEKKLKVHIDKIDTYYLNVGYDEKKKADIVFDLKLLVL